MLCEACGGLGRALCRTRPIMGEMGDAALEFAPCPACGGFGIVSCCEGTERHTGVAGQPGGETGMELSGAPQ